MDRYYQRRTGRELDFILPGVRMGMDILEAFYPNLLYFRDRLSIPYSSPKTLSDLPGMTILAIRAMGEMLPMSSENVKNCRVDQLLPTL
jgi:hypothetical protein